MPLAPQITNTPIPYSTWYSAGDYDNSATAVVTPTSTYYAAPTPNANAIGDIWFDTTNGNKQYRWDGSSWVSVQDTSIATATSTANSAYSLATTAAATANGKNQVYFSSTTPGSTANNAGDIWYQYGSYGIVTNQWVGAGGTSWTAVTLTNVTVSSITAGAITAGTITTAVGISNPSGTFTLNGSTGALTVSNITATGGYIGGTSGWIISSGGYLSNSALSTVLYPSGNTYALITDRAISAANGIYISGSSSTSVQTNGGISASGAITCNSLTSNNAITSNGGTSSFLNANFVSTVSISGGYGVTSDWSPNSDNTYNLGISGSRRWSHVYANNTTITTSDQRLKTNITTSALGLNFINSLRPVSYQWIEGGKQLVLDDKGQPVVESTDSNGKPVYKTTSTPGKRTHYGLIAQEVKSALDAANVGDFAGWVQDDITNPDSFQSVSYEQFISPLIKAVQELSAEIQTLKGATNGTAAN